MGFEEPEWISGMPGSGVLTTNYCRQKHYASNIKTRLMMSIIMNRVLPKKLKNNTYLPTYLPIIKDCETQM
jgi:hypothetical protein